MTRGTAPAALVGEPLTPLTSVTSGWDGLSTKTLLPTAKSLGEVDTLPLNPPWPGTRLPAVLWKAMTLPSPLITGKEDPPAATVSEPAVWLTRLTEPVDRL